MGRYFKAYSSCLFLLFGVLSLPFSGQAQTFMPFELHWERGTLVLHSGDTIKGRTVITLPEDLVRVYQPNGNFQTYLPVDIHYLEVEGEQIRDPYRKPTDQFLNRREYRPFNWDRDQEFSNFRAPALFVTLAYGKYSLLMREEKRKVRNSSGAGIAGAVAGPLIGLAVQHEAEKVMLERWYLASPQRGVRRLNKPKKQILGLFPYHRKTIKKFASANRLRFDNLPDLAHIINYCNRLEEIGR